MLRYGSLPVELEPQAVQTVSATLGQDSLRAGLVAGLIGLLLVVLYMLLYYRALGLVVHARPLRLGRAALVDRLPARAQTRGLALTLAGVTGIIVSIGVTVDSYVVYFERLKDDVRLGPALRSSAERSFTRACRTILAADVVLADRRRRALVPDGRLGAGLRLLPRPVDGARPRRRLLLHAPGGRSC